MASLKRDTPAGRAALVRRRQRAAAVVDHAARFGHDTNNTTTTTSPSEDEGSRSLRAVSATSEDSSHDPPPPQHPPPPPRGVLPDPPPQPPPPQHGRGTATGSYSTAELPSSNELLERSSQVAREAAAVLASARHETASSHQATIVSFLRRDERTDHDDDNKVVEEDPTGHRRDAPTEASTARPFQDPRGSAVDEEKEAPHYPQHHQQHQQPSYHPEDLDDDHDDHEIVQEEPTMEELEPLVSSEATTVDVDAACITSGSSIRLRSFATATTVVNTTNTDSDSDSDTDSELARVGGTGLGTTGEIMRIVPVSLSAGVAPEGDDQDTEQQQEVTIVSSTNDQPRPLRWGDTVVFLSSTPPRTRHTSSSTDRRVVPSQQIMALGIRRKTSPYGSHRPVDYEVGWFHSTVTETDTWTLLRGLDTSRRGVRVGRAATERTKQLAQQRTARGQCTHWVQSGDPILLRHTPTGGILSVTAANGRLQLVTDSYHRREAASASRDVLSQLQRHDRYLPTDHDTFALVQASVPPCPRWILAGGTSSSAQHIYHPKGHRMYLHQTYLSVADRHHESPATQERLFGRSWTSLSLGVGDPSPGMTPPRRELPEQERLLIDEVIGACLGLEGNHIVCRPLFEDHDNDNCSIENQTIPTIMFGLREGSERLFDASIRNLVQLLLPLATSYVHVSVFVASHLPGYEFGSVMQAFCEAVDGMLQEYAIFVAELEQRFRLPSTRDILTLRRLHAQLTPSLHSMSILERATVAVRNKKGGDLINALSTLKAWSCEGDLVANQIMTILLDKASIPYMTMLTSWLQRGLLRDPYAEFMIEIQDHSTSSSSSSNRSNSKHAADSDFNNVSYTVREEHCLTELLSSDVLLQKVVATGKYWRAVRDCEVALRRKQAPLVDGTTDDELRQPAVVLQYSLSFNSISSFIHSMYEGASQALVHLLLEDFRLIDALRSMKNYFLFGHGDFLGLLLDSAEDELVKELGDVSTGRIQHWLRMSIQMTEAHSENRRPTKSSPNPRDRDQKRFPEESLSPMALRCRFAAFSLINHVEALDEEKTKGRNARSSANESMLNTPSRDAYGSSKGLTGVETLVLDFPSIPFPISLVLSDGSLDKYQLLFRLLFFAKYVERRLVGIWQDHQAMKELNSIRGLFGPTFLLRQRMLHFAQNLIYYIMFEVIEPNWMNMAEVIGNPDTTKKTVDDIVDLHEAFLQQTLEACLLTNKELVRTLTKLMTTCLMFADQMRLFTEATKIHDESSHIAAERRKTIQRNLNERGGGGATKPVDKKVLREAMNSFKQDRQHRLKKQRRRVGRELSSESYRKMVVRFDEVFSAYLSEFMTQLNSGGTGTLYHAHKTNLCIRLDYNGFLSSSIVVDSKSQTN